MFLSQYKISRIDLQYNLIFISSGETISQKDISWSRTSSVNLGWVFILIVLTAAAKNAENYTIR